LALFVTLELLLMDAISRWLLVVPS